MTKETSASQELAADCSHAVGGDILKIDVLGQMTVGGAQRDAILYALELLLV